MGDPSAVRNGADSVPQAFPLPTCGSGQLNIALVRADPDHISVEGTRSDDRDRGAALVFGAVHRPYVSSESVGVGGVPPILPSSRQIVGSQVTADDLPGPTPISALVDELTPIVDAFGVMRIERDRCVPIKAELCEVRSPRSNELPLAVWRLK